MQASTEPNGLSALSPRQKRDIVLLNARFLKIEMIGISSFSMTVIHYVYCFAREKAGGWGESTGRTRPEDSSTFCWAGTINPWPAVMITPKLSFTLLRRKMANGPQ